ncbi:MAG: hypothetical protein ACREF3_13625 [Acetobacteraceae bacterium]
MGPDREAVRRVLGAAAPKDIGDGGFDRAVWRALWALTWQAPGACGHDGRPGPSALALCLVAEELGAALRPEPFIPAVMAARLLPANWLRAVVAGERIVLPAWQEHPGGLETARTTVLCDGRLRGRKVLIPMAPAVDGFVVTLPDGAALVERDGGGLRLEIADMGDGVPIGSLVLDGAPAERIPGDVGAALDEAILASAAYLLGLMDRAASLTRGALASRRNLTRRTRVVEALRQQRMDEIAVQLVLTRSAVGSAAATLDATPRAAVRGSVVSKAWLRGVDAGLVVTRACVLLVSVQALPGVAELERFQRRAGVVGRLYGSVMAHRARFPVGPG